MERLVLRLLNNFSANDLSRCSYVTTYVERAVNLELGAAKLIKPRPRGAPGSPFLEEAAVAGLAGPSGAGVEGGGLGAATARASHRCMAWARGLMQSPAPGVRGWGGRASWGHRGLFFPTHLVPSSCPRAGFRASQRARHRVERSPLAKPRTAGCGWRLLGAMAELGVGAPPAVPPPPLRQPLGRTSGRGRHGALHKEEATFESRETN